MEITGKTIEEIEIEKENSDVKLIEAILFVAGKFLSFSELIAYSNLDSISIRESLKKIKEKYSKDDSSLELIERGDLWKLDVKQEYHWIVNKLATGSVEFTKAEQQTLAIIAYKQPIKQSVIIKIRGNKAYDHIHKFLELGLIKSKKEGHTNILTISEEFYNYFNLSETGKNPFNEEFDE